MPPIFDKDRKLKVIEYGDHSKSIHFNHKTLWCQITAFFRRFFNFAH